MAFWLDTGLIQWVQMSMYQDLRDCKIQWTFLSLSGISCVVITVVQSQWTWGCVQLYLSWERREPRWFPNTCISFSLLIRSWLSPSRTSWHSPWASLILSEGHGPLRVASFHSNDHLCFTGADSPHHYMNLQALQNQCPLTAANALITEMSLAMTYLSHYPPIIGGNFKQIDLRSVSSPVSMQEDTWLPSQTLSRWPEHIIAHSRCGSDSRLGNLHVLHAKLSSLTLGLCSKSFSLTFQNFSELKLSLTFLVLVLNLMHKQFSGDVEEIRLQSVWITQHIWLSCSHL